MDYRKAVNKTQTINVEQNASKTQSINNTRKFLWVKLRCVSKFIIILRKVINKNIADYNQCVKLKAILQKRIDICESELLSLKTSCVANDKSILSSEIKMSNSMKTTQNTCHHIWVKHNVYDCEWKKQFYKCPICLYSKSTLPLPAVGFLTEKTEIPVFQGNHKKKLCMFFTQGKCYKGSKCTYAHGKNDLILSPNYLFLRS
tara:strand:+ start:6154 stop:6759 length:606 start_codon:yes stop_codon:yes gene_type:complete